VQSVAGSGGGEEERMNGMDDALEPGGGMPCPECSGRFNQPATQGTITCENGHRYRVNWRKPTRIERVPEAAKWDGQMEKGDLIHVQIPGEPTRLLIVTDVEESDPGSATISVIADPFPEG
jgi:hypothetical protein